MRELEPEEVDEITGKDWEAVKEHLADLVYTLYCAWRRERELMNRLETDEMTKRHELEPEEVDKIDSEGLCFLGTTKSTEYVQNLIYTLRLAWKRERAGKR